jgi:hypothetical protein
MRACSLIKTSLGASSPALTLWRSRASSRSCAAESRSEQIQPPARALPIGQRRGQGAAHGPGLIHQLQARIAGVETGDLAVQAARSGERNSQFKLTPYSQG